MNRLQKATAPYQYTFPEELIARAPAVPRDAARLMVYNRRAKTVQEDSFSHIVTYLPPRSVLVFNETKVLPARLLAHKETGGAVRLLYIDSVSGSIRVMADRHLAPGARVTIARAPRLFFTVQKQDGRYYLLRPSFSSRRIFSVLERYGTTPLPPYIKNSPLTERARKEKYQSVLAKTRGSVAAPTASLHFTKRLIRQLTRAGHTVVRITLHVNAGTFAPVTEQNIQTGTLHSEWYTVSPVAARVLARARREKRPVIAVGTTAVRALESAATHAHGGTRRDTHGGALRAVQGTTDLFIRTGYRFRVVDGLITNFHVPGSSLLMLVSAFAGRPAIRRLYARAIRKKYRLFSFGEGMLIL